MTAWTFPSRFGRLGRRLSSFALAASFVAGMAQTASAAEPKPLEVKVEPCEAKAEAPDAPELGLKLMLRSSYVTEANVGDTETAEPILPASARAEPPAPVHPMVLREAEAQAEQYARMEREMQLYEARRKDRPMVGTGLTAAGGFMAAAGLGMLVGALIVPQFAEVEGRTRLIVGATGIPTMLIGIGITVSTASRHDKFERWADRAGLEPPKSGNVLIVVGSLLSVASATAMGFSIDSNRASAGMNADEWGTVAAGAVATTLGLVALGGGIAMRVRFQRWERQRLSAGPMTLARGAGLSISGRF